MNCAIFYGKRSRVYDDKENGWLQKLAKLRRTVKTPPPSPPKDIMPLAGLSSTSTSSSSQFTLFISFSRLREAIDYIDSMASEHALDRSKLMVFAYEHADIGSGGARRFAVCNWQGLHAQIREPRRLWHLYEIICEHCACNLYFDLEYSLKFDENRRVDSDALMRAFFGALFEQLGRQIAAIRCAVTHSMCIDLSASTADKFSRHVIVRLPEHSWRSNRECGNFVSRFLAELYACRERDGDNDNPSAPWTARLSRMFLMVCDDDGNRSAFIDRGVYTKNRCFRVLGSFKLGKDRAQSTLRFADSCQFKVPDDECAAFDSTLVCNVDGGDNPLCQLIDCSPPQAAPPLAVVPVSGDRHRRRQPMSAATAAAASSSSSSPAMRKGAHGGSLFPAIDAYVVRELGNGAYVRSWFQLSDDDDKHIFVYSIGGTRFCERIGREHRSNNVNVVVSLRNHYWRRSCLDPDCRQFCATRHPLPLSLVAEHRMAAQSMARTPDHLFLEALEKMN
jgi:DNA-directed primase/polymerase protein